MKTKKIHSLFLRITIILGVVLGISVGLLAGSAIAENSPTPACTDQASCMGTDEPPLVPDDEPPPADTGMIDDGEESSVSEEVVSGTQTPEPIPPPVEAQAVPAPDPPSPPPAETVTTITTSAPKAPQPKSDGTEAQPTAVVLPPQPQPPHAGYCDATGKFYELEVGQYKTDPFWAAKGPWTDAYRDPVTGSLTCDMPKKESETPASMPNRVTPEASVTQLKAEPPPRLKPEPKRRIPAGVPIPAPPG